MKNEKTVTADALADAVEAFYNQYMGVTWQIPNEEMLRLVERVAEYRLADLHGKVAPY